MYLTRSLHSQIKLDSCLCGPQPISLLLHPLQLSLRASPSTYKDSGHNWSVVGIDVKNRTLPPWQQLDDVVLGAFTVQESESAVTGQQQTTRLPFLLEHMARHKGATAAATIAGAAAGGAIAGPFGIAAGTSS